MNDQHTCEKLTKKRFSRRIVITFVATIFAATLSGGVIYAGLASRDVGKISDELVILDENGVQQASVTATQSYSHSTRAGALSLEIKKDRVRIATVSATLTADTQQQAAGA